MGTFVFLTTKRHTGILTRVLKGTRHLVLVHEAAAAVLTWDLRRVIGETMRCASSDELSRERHTSGWRGCPILLRWFRLFRLSKWQDGMEQRHERSAGPLKDQEERLDSTRETTAAGNQRNQSKVLYYSVRSAGNTIENVFLAFINSKQQGPSA